MMNRPSRFHVCLLLAGLLPVTTAFPLDWKTQFLSVKAAPFQKTAETAFAFKNTSGKPVSILAVDTSCDCLEARASAKTFAPGETGLISAHFTVGDRHGVYERTITVTTDEESEATNLRVQLDVPEIATLTPRSVDWKLNGAAEEQTVDIVVSEGLALAISDVQPTNEAFTFTLEAVQAGRHYRLRLAPKSTKESTNAAFRLHARAQTGQDVIFSAYANVR